jgi:hypothetical protein
MRNLSELVIGGLIIESFRSPTHFTFPTLLTLQMGPGCNIDNTIMFLRSISAPCMSSLDISLYGESGLEWSLLFHVINKKFSSAPLSNLHFEGWVQFALSYQFLTIEDIHPLYNFPEVMNFFSNSTFRLKSDDRWIQEITSA